jgi:glutamyl endopeptidase
MRTHLIRALWLVAALAVVIISSFQAVSASAAVSAAQARTSSTIATRVTTPMTIVRVARLLTRTPGKDGKIEVQLVNGAVIAIPAADENLVMWNAAAHPHGTVRGSCGSSFIYLYDKTDAHPLKVYTGFKVKRAAVAYGWYYTVTGPDGFKLTASLKGTLDFRHSWSNTYSTPLDYLQGDYKAEVSKSSFALLYTGAVCYSGGPTAKNLLTSPDAPVGWNLSTVTDTTPVASPAASAIPTVSAVPGFAGYQPGVSPRSVIGKDTRKRVENTADYPYRAIALLIMTFSNGEQSSCTGFFISPSTVATAGHCLDSKSDGLTDHVVVIPGNNANIEPFGYCLGIKAYSVTGWVDDKTPPAPAPYDYGAVKLNCSIGNEVGWLGLRWQSSSLTRTSVTITGYPNDKKPDDSMWTASGKITGSPGRELLYTISTAPGQSGSPVYTSGNIALAIHAYGVTLAYPHANAGTRITQAAFDNLYAWRS